GDMKYQDLNGDGKITRGVQTLDDHGDLVVIGNSSPRYNITAIGGFNWKGFDFYMHWAGIGKRDYSPHVENAFFWGLVTAWGNSALVKGSDWKDYWRPEGETGRFGPNTDAYFPKPYFSSESLKNKQVQSRYLLDAAYLRLKNLQIGYTIPTEISSKVFVKQARIFISGSNLLTITKFPKSMDPETTPVSYNVGAVYPISRSYSAGVNITF
ncbi:MAG TPA: SusC/RagA family protein, partial [Chryseosolibacter sp.]|nr:SusC/RagA family protein [Chryseosolibacter sp.]